MDIRITADPHCLGAAARARLEKILRGVLAARAGRIRQLAVCLDDLSAARGQWGWECRLYARLAPSGAKAVFGDGDSAELALRGAADLLAWTLRSEDCPGPVSGQVASSR